MASEFTWEKDSPEKLLIERFIAPKRLSKKNTTKEWKNPVGAWADMPDTVDEMFEAFEKIRHANPPSPLTELP